MRYRRLFALGVALALFTSHARTDEGIPPDTVAAVKKASAFVRVEGKNWKGTGSGFVVAANKDGVLVATNYHVVAGPDTDVRLNPLELIKSFKNVTVSTVFEGGTKNEASAKAEILAADPENDLAVLRVTGLTNPPTPIEYANAPKPVETMTVYTFGYPFGQALALGKASPAITVGKAGVSSLRLDDDGELALVQIDGALNPGNSGGPVVDTKGRLIGVAVSRIRDGQGIGFAVPAAELDKLMKGRVGEFHLTATKAADGKLAVKAEIGLLDPTNVVKGATLHYVLVPPKGAKPKPGTALDKHPEARKVALKVNAGIASGELTLPSAEGDIVLQVTPDGVPGGVSKVRSYSLAAPKGNDAVVLGGAGGGAGAGEVDPPAGWKEYTPANKLYKVWIPEKPKSQNEKTSTSTRPPLRLTSNILAIETVAGATYTVEQVLITPARFNDRDELTKLLREVAIGDAKAVRETDAKMGRFPGKEYTAERGAEVSRARAFVIGSSLYLLRVTGRRDLVTGADANTFLDSCRLQVPNPAAPAQPNPAVPQPPFPQPPFPQPPMPGAPVAKEPDRGPRLHGWPFDPESRDATPPGGHLAGLEVGTGKHFNTEVVKAVRPIYFVGNKHAFGEQFGSDTAKVTQVIAKPGYAVGAITIRTTITMNSVQITFMKLTADGKLNPKDAYDSDLIGTEAGGPVKMGGDGSLAVGILLKVNAKDIVTGLGLIYSDTNKPGLDAPWPRGTPTALVGGGNDREFREVGPDGSLLAGLEIGIGRFVNIPVIKAVRPVFRVGEKDSDGEWHGPTDKPVVVEFVRVVAKPGYAVGGMKVCTGLGMNGLSITFMKVTDGKLDPTDKYESEWIAHDKGGTASVGGDGTPVIGLIGKARADCCSGLGLLLPPAAKK